MTRKLLALFVLAALPSLASAQTADIKPVTLGQTMPEITLPSLQGGSVSLSALRGKNVLLVFPRVFYAENGFCTLCNYQYAELVDLELKQQIRKKHGVEVLFVLPFGADVAGRWLEVLPGELQKVHDYKHPKDPAALDEKGKNRMRIFSEACPKDILAKDLETKPGEVARPFPILLDADRRLSKGLDLFRTEWTGGKGDQNIPAVFVLDGKGVVRFKYVSQNTLDRPSAAHLLGELARLGPGR